MHRKTPVNAADQFRLPLGRLAEEYGLRIDSMRCLPSRINNVWHLCGPDGAFVLRQSHSRRSKVSLIFELTVLEALASINCTVPAPVRTKSNKRSLCHCNAYYSIFRYVDGKSVRSLESASLTSIGATLKALHKVSRPMLRPMVRPYVWLVDEGRRVWLVARRELPVRLVRCGDEILTNGLSTLRSFIGQSSSAVICHNDVHPGNVINSNNRFFLLDFDDCIPADPAFDLTSAAVSGALLGEKCSPLSVVLQELQGGYGKSNESFQASINKLLPIVLLIRFSFFFIDSDPNQRRTLQNRFERVLHEVRRFQE